MSNTPKEKIYMKYIKCKNCNGTGYTKSYYDDLVGPLCQHCSGSGKVEIASPPKPVQEGA